MSWDERDHLLDKYQYLTTSATGIELANVFRKTTGKSLFPTSEYLALGAGGAIGELAFAAELGIDPARITLVDKDLSAIHKAHPATRRVCKPISLFLSETPTRKYDIVSAFGMEYVLKEKVLPEFLNALTPHLTIGSYVFIYYYEGKNVEHTQFQLKLSSKIEHTARPICYQFTGEKRRR